MANVKPEVIQVRRARAWELRQEGWSHARIGAELGVDASTVTRYLQRESAAYGKRHTAQVDAVKGQQIAALEYIADEALQAWRRSIGEVTSTTRKSVTLTADAAGEDGPFEVHLPAEEVTTRTEDHVGEVAYLAEARAALGEIRKIVGANAATPRTDAAGDPLDAIKIYIDVDLERV